MWKIPHCCFLIIFVHKYHAQLRLQSKVLYRVGEGEKKLLYGSILQPPSLFQAYRAQIHSQGAILQPPNGPIRALGVWKRPLKPRSGHWAAAKSLRGHKSGLWRHTYTHTKSISSMSIIKRTLCVINAFSFLTQC